VKASSDEMDLGSTHVGHSVEGTPTTNSTDKDDAMTTTTSGSLGSPQEADGPDGAAVDFETEVDTSPVSVLREETPPHQTAATDLGSLIEEGDAAFEEPTDESMAAAFGKHLETCTAEEWVDFTIGCARHGQLGSIDWKLYVSYGAPVPRESVVAQCQEILAIKSPEWEWTNWYENFGKQKKMAGDDDSLDTSGKQPADLVDPVKDSSPTPVAAAVETTKVRGQIKPGSTYAFIGKEDFAQWVTQEVKAQDWVDWTAGVTASERLFYAGYDDYGTPIPPEEVIEQCKDLISHKGEGFVKDWLLQFGSGIYDPAPSKPKLFMKYKDGVGFRKWVTKEASAREWVEWTLEVDYNERRWYDDWGTPIPPPDVIEECKPIAIEMFHGEMHINIWMLQYASGEPQSGPRHGEEYWVDALIDFARKASPAEWKAHCLMEQTDPPHPNKVYKILSDTMGTWPTKWRWKPTEPVMRRFKWKAGSSKADWDKWKEALFPVGGLALVGASAVGKAEADEQAEAATKATEEADEAEAQVEEADDSSINPVE
jgi:hypothetical protein